MKNGIVIILFLFYMKSSMAQSFIITDCDSISKLVKERQGEFSFQDSFTKAQVFLLADGRAIAYPAVGSKGIIVEDERTMIDILKHGFPIKEEHPNPFQKEQNKIVSLDKNVDQYLKELSDKLSVKIDLSDTTDKYYKEIDNAVKLFGFEKIYEELFVQFGVFIGEKIRNDIDGIRWELEQHYSYNPYFEPILRGNDKMVYRPWFKLAQLLLKKKKFSFKDYYSSAKVAGY